MPALRNVKHEVFVQNIVTRHKNGWTNTECYQHAGYTATGNGAEAAACKLLSSAKIKSRIAERQREQGKKSVTVASLIDELDETRERALVTDQLGTARQASMDKGKLKGLLVDRVESGSAGEFSGAQTVESVVQIMLGDGDPHQTLAILKGMIECIEATIAAEAIDVTPADRPDIETGG